MSKLKKYNEFLFEADEPTVQTTSAPTTTTESTEVNTETVDKLFNDLKNVVSKKIEENKKLINGYYNKTTKDGQEINTTDEFYTYGIYNGNQKVDNKKMTFVIKFNELNESGLTYNIIGSVDNTELKNIEAKEVEIVKKSTDGSTKLNPGFINGKYVVKNKDKVNILKPKEEQKPQEKNDTTPTPGIIFGNVYKYEGKTGRYLIINEVEGSEGKKLNAQDIDADVAKLVSIDKDKVKEPIGSFPKVMISKIEDASFDKKDLVQLKKVKSIVDIYDEKWWKLGGKKPNDSDMNRLKKLIHTYINPLEKQETVKPVEQKPVEQKPVEQKPVEQKPVEQKSKNQF